MSANHRAGGLGGRNDGRAPPQAERRKCDPVSAKEHGVPRSQDEAASGRQARQFRPNQNTAQEIGGIRRAHGTQDGAGAGLKDRGAEAEPAGGLHTGPKGTRGKAGSWTSAQSAVLREQGEELAGRVRGETGDASATEAHVLGMGAWKYRAAVLREQPAR